MPCFWRRRFHFPPRFRPETDACLLHIGDETADSAREIYQMGFEFYGQDEEGIDKSQSLYSAFAKMEVRHKEYDRARVIYKVGSAQLDLSVNMDRRQDRG